MLRISVGVLLCGCSKTNIYADSLQSNSPDSNDTASASQTGSDSGTVQADDTAPPSDTSGYTVELTPGSGCTEADEAWPAERWTDETWQSQTVTSASGTVPTAAWGTAIGDYDSNGFPDIFLPQIGVPELFFNEGNRTWRKASTTELPMGPALGLAATAVDLDDDGDIDIVETGFGMVRLLLNDGTGTFALGPAITVDPTTIYFGSSWADMDGDGDLDGIVAAFPSTFPGGEEQTTSTFIPGAPDILLERTADGWNDASDRLPDTNDGHTFLSAWQDIDGDSRPEIIVVNDHFIVGRSNRVWSWVDGIYQDVSETQGLNQGMHSMGLGITDRNADGRPDLLITGWGNLAWMVSDVGGGPWINRTAADGLFVAKDDDQWVGWGVEFADLDNDGTEEGIVAFGQWELAGLAGHDESENAEAQPDAIYRFGADGATDEAAAWTMADTSAGRGVAVADLDRDGRMDVIRRPVFSAATIDSPRCSSNHWATVSLRQPAPNTHGIGARVTVRSNGDPSVRWIRAGGTGLASGSVAEVHVGLGEAEVIDEIEVLWPDGQTSTHVNVPADHHIVIRREDGL